MSWTDSLRPASFRGVPFSLAGEPGTEGGRRSQVHLFPGRDLPWVEDLGKSPRQLRLQAFVVGDDYMTQRDALLSACEEPGPGTLVHPFFGSLRVSCLGFSCQDGRRMATLELSFILSGEPLHPTSTQDTQAVVARRVEDALDISSIILDETMDYSGASYVLQSALSAVRDMAARVSGVRTVIADAARYARSVAAVAGLSGPDLAALPGLSALLRPLVSDLGPAAVVDHAARLAELSALPALFPLPGQPARRTPSRLRELANLTACADYATRLATAEMARSAALVLPESAQAAFALREQVVSAIDGVMERTGSDEVFSAFQALRTATVRDLAERARQAPQVAAIAPRLTDNLLTLSHRAQGSIALVEDTLRRNGVRHPGFPGMTALEVLRV